MIAALRARGSDPGLTDLDVVVLGGGGHVGLPLSLVLARAGLSGRDLRHESGHGRADPGRPDAVHGDRRGGAAERAPADRPARARVRSDDDRPLAGDRGGHRDAGRRVPRPVDDRLREGGRPDRAAPPRRCARRPPQHRLSGHDRVRRAASRRAAAAASTSCSARSGSPRATRSRSSAACPRSSAPTPIERRTRAEALFGRIVAKPVRTSTREAELAKLLTNAWRYMKFAVANQFFMIAAPGRGRLHERPAARSATTTRGPGPARTRASPPGPCLFKDTMQLAAFTTDHFPLGHSAMQVNEGLPDYIVSALERRYGSLDGETVGILGMAFKAESRRHRAHRSATSSASSSAWAGAPGPLHRPVRRRRAARAARRGRSAESDLLVLGAPHAAYRALDARRQATSSTSGTPRQRASACEDPRHRRRRVHLRLPRRGAAGRAATRSSGSTTSPSTARSPSRTTGTRATAFVEGDAKDVGAAEELAARLRPVRRRGGDDRRDQLLPRVRLRPASPRTSGSPRRPSTPRSPPTAPGTSSGSPSSARRWSSRSATVFPTPEGAQLTQPAAASRPTASRSWRPSTSPSGALRAVRAALHDRPAVQLRRRSASGGRSATADVMSGNVKLAMSHVVPDLVQKVLKGQDPLHILGDGQPGPPLHLRRRPGPRHPAGDGVAGGRQRRLQPLDGGQHDGARAGRGDLAQGQRPRAAAAAYVSRPAVRATTSRGASPTCARRGTSSASRRPRPLDEMLDEVIPWIRAELEAGRI